ncbi:MIP/aquaporin family protein [Lapidilactobacillus dextrinicus]|uniref:MIP/aquaporin family protein n=1 Tax=Lapidilactobacillus dextrinicus TaxID=51664 RepID=UPI003F27C50A
MTYPLAIRLAAEFIGTAIMVLLGNGSVANVDLKGTKGEHGGWILISLGYGAGVMIPALIFGGISGNHINPAFTLGLAFSGLFPWHEVLPYITVQLLGAFVGQAIVVLAYKPYYNMTTNPDSILGTFSTIDNAHSRFNGFINEFVGTYILVFAALGITKAPFFNNNLGTAHLALGFLVMTLVASLGGPTGPALNPARDLSPRILHSLLPLKNKSDSHWRYAWVPVVAPILAGILAVFTYKNVFLIWHP